MRTLQQNSRLHGLFSRLKLNRDVIEDLVMEITGGRTTHTSELEFIEAKELINYLENMQRKAQIKPAHRISLTIDQKRKGLIKAIGKWYEMQGKVVDIDYIKGTAVQAAGFDVRDFNKIPEPTLSRLYAEFCKKQHTVKVKNKKYNIYSNN